MNTPAFFGINKTITFKYLHVLYIHMKKVSIFLSGLLALSIAGADPAPLNSIQMMDHYPSPAGIPVTIFIIFVFLSFVAILYAASMLACDAKEKGHHHPHKKK